MFLVYCGYLSQKTLILYIAASMDGVVLLGRRDIRGGVDRPLGCLKLPFMV
jgi:hypothetical protein